MRRTLMNFELKRWNIGSSVWAVGKIRRIVILSAGCGYTFVEYFSGDLLGFIGGASISGYFLYDYLIRNDEDVVDLREQVVQIKNVKDELKEKLIDQTKHSELLIQQIAELKEQWGFQQQLGNDLQESNSQLKGKLDSLMEKLSQVEQGNKGLLAQYEEYYGKMIAAKSQLSVFREDLEETRSVLKHERGALVEVTKKLVSQQQINETFDKKNHQRLEDTLEKLENVKETNQPPKQRKSVWLQAH